MTDKYDVIIVGAGLGGLTAGAKLAREGKKILVVEQHRVVGGCATAFSRKGRTFEVGLHEMGSMKRESRIQMFKDIDVYDRLEFIRVPEFYRVIKGDLDVVIPDEIPAAIEILKLKFPAEEKNLRKYFTDISDIRKASYLMRWPLSRKILNGPLFLYKIRKLLKHKKTTVGVYFDNLTDNEDLKLTLIANLGYYHDDPYTLSFLFFALGQTSYMEGGGWFVKGGSQKLSDALADVIRENGGEILLRCMVDEIIVKDKKAVGIVYHKKNDEVLKKVLADKIVSNASLISVANKLIPSLDNTKVQQKVNDLETTCSLLTIYYSFTEPISHYFENRYSTFYFNKKQEKLEDTAYFVQTEDYKEKAFVFVDYNAIDSGMNSDGNYTASLCAADYIDQWEDLEEEEYKNKKEEVIKVFNNRLEAMYPGISKLIGYSEMSTPRTIRKFTLNPYGTVYGFAQTPKQALTNKGKIIRSEIKNLHFAGAGVMAGGFGGSIASGYLCATEILNNEE